MGRVQSLCNHRLATETHAYIFTYLKFKHVCARSNVIVCELRFHFSSGNHIGNMNIFFVGHGHPLSGTLTLSLGDMVIFSRGHAHRLGGAWASPLGDIVILFVGRGHVPWAWTSSLGDMDIFAVIL